MPAEKQTFASVWSNGCNGPEAVVVTSNMSGGFVLQSHSKSLKAEILPRLF
jgi:hypothetical protein